MNRKYYFYYLLSFLFFCSSCQKNISINRPNFVVILSDDVSPEQQSHLYGANFAQTPAFDAIAKNGLLFNFAYTSTSCCAPARASLLTCRNIWQNEEAGCQLSVFPNTFPTYVESLNDNGYHCGSYANTWKPGKSLRAYTAGKIYGDNKMSVESSLDLFLNENIDNKPFHFIVNANEGHSPFDFSKWKNYKDRLSTVNVPSYLPDNLLTKKRILTVNYEIEMFDYKIKSIVNYLTEHNLIDNTVIIVSSDNGTTLSGNGKGQGAYETGCRVPLAIQWLNGVESGGRVIDDLVTQMDVSKTILDLANVKPAVSMTEGKSLKNIFDSTKSGNVDESRDAVFFGFERHIINKPQNQSCYPIRSIRTNEYLYIWNLKKERHIWGPNNIHWFDEHGKPKSEIVTHKGKKTMTYYNSYTKIRPSEELFDMKNDRACLINLAGKPQYEFLKKELRKRLLNKLETDGDPRTKRKGYWFDMAPFPPDMMKHATTEGCRPYKESYRSPFDRSDYPDEIKARPWKAEIQ